MRASILLSLVAARGASAKDLTVHNWYQEVAFKNILVLFCNNDELVCPFLKPKVWDTIMADYAENPNIGVYHVNCAQDDDGKPCVYKSNDDTTEGGDYDEAEEDGQFTGNHSTCGTLCKRNGITSVATAGEWVPQILYGPPAKLQQYDGDVTWNHKTTPKTIQQFVDFVVGDFDPLCSPSNMDECKGEEKKMLESLSKWTDEQLTKRLASFSKTQAKFEAIFPEIEKIKVKEYKNLKKFNHWARCIGGPGSECKTNLAKYEGIQTDLENERTKLSDLAKTIVEKSGPPQQRLNAMTTIGGILNLRKKEKIEL